MRKALVLAVRTARGRLPSLLVATVARKDLAQRIRGRAGVQRRIRVIEPDKCAQVIKKREVRSDERTSTSMSTPEGVATEPKGIQGSTSMPIAGADLTGAMSMSTCAGTAIALVTARRFCVAIGNAELAEIWRADGFWSGA